MSEYAVIDLVSGDTYTVIGEARQIVRRSFDAPGDPLQLTRVTWENPDVYPEDTDWRYEELPVWVRPTAVVAVTPLSGKALHALNVAKVEAD